MSKADNPRHRISEAALTSSLLDQTASRVRGEIANYLAQSEGNTTYYFLDDFPSALIPVDPDKPLTRRSLQFSLPLRDIPYGDRVDNVLFPLYGPKDYSKAFRKDTPASFFEAVDTAMALEGVDAGIVQQMLELAEHPGGFMKVRRERLAEYVLPVYIRLRAQGYKHFELTH
jgi:hypothetical protein